MTIPTTRPLLLLDVDGPLNPFAAKPCRRPPGYLTHRFPVPPWNLRRPLRVWLHPDHGGLLLGLAEHFDLVWATSWQQHANTFIGPALGLPELPFVPFPNEREPLWAATEWKWVEVGRHAQGRHLAWLDDGFDLAPAAFGGFLPSRLKSKLRTLLVNVDPKIGMTQAHIDELATWAAELRKTQS